MSGTGKAGARPGRDVLRWIAATPARLLIASWIAALLLFYLGPVEYGTRPGLGALAIMSGSCAAFVAGSWLQTRVVTPRPPAAPLSAKVVNRVALACAVLGLTGGLCIVLDKLLLKGIDYSGGLTSARMQQQDSVASGNRSYGVIALGFALFSFSNVAVLLFVLRGEMLTPWRRRLSFLSVIWPFVFSASYGARAALFQELLLIAGAAWTRKLCGMPAIPRVPRIRILLALLLAGAVAYNSMIFAERREYLYQSSYDRFIERLATDVGASPGERSERLVDAGAISPDAFLDVYQTTFYFTHGISCLERLVESSENVGPYYGAAQNNWFATIIDKFFPDLANVRSRELDAVGLNGYVTTAWGMILMDFGLAGLAIEVFVLGWYSSTRWRRSLAFSELESQLMMSFCIMSILASPLCAPFAVANAFLIWISLGATAVFFRRARRPISARTCVPSSS